MWVIAAGIALLTLSLLLLLVVAGGGAWHPDDEEPVSDPDPYYVSPLGYHRHRCSKCGWVWEHRDTCAGDDLEHRCPECGHDDGDPTHGWPRYYGPLPPTTRTP